MFFSDSRSVACSTTDTAGSLEAFARNLLKMWWEKSPAYTVNGEGRRIGYDSKAVHIVQEAICPVVVVFGYEDIADALTRQLFG